MAGYQTAGGGLMKTKFKKIMNRSSKIVSFCVLSLALFGCIGCAQEKPLVFDYASQPDEFIVKLKPNQRYTIVRGSETFPFCLTLTKSFISDGGESRLIWKKIDRKAHMLRATERVPYLIRANGKDFLYIYGDKYGDLNFIELSDTNSVRGADNAQLFFYEEPKDPNNLPVRITIPVLGPASAELRYHVGNLGRPVPNETDGYRYCVAADRQEKFITTVACQVMFFASADAQEGIMTTLPSGSVFSKLRCNGKGETDLLLEDGRVFRVKERYLFSEPHAIMDVVDFAGKPFSYKSMKKN